MNELAQKLYCEKPISWHFGLPCLCPERATHLSPGQGVLAAALGYDPQQFSAAL